MLKRLPLLFSLALVALLALPAHAQDTPALDFEGLARQMLAYDGEPFIPPPTPAYRPGAVETFWVSRAGSDRPEQISAELAAAAPNIYLWVEAGLTYDADEMNALAGQLNTLYGLLLLKDNVGGVRVVPRSSLDIAVRETLFLPDVDNDPHLFIVYAQNLSADRTTVFNPFHSLPADQVPGSFSNQHEMLFVNTSALPGVELHNSAYLNVLALQLYQMFAFYNTPGQAAWLHEALSWYTLMSAQNAPLRPQDLTAFFEAPNTSLVRQGGASGVGQAFGAQQLFLRYVLQRYGSDVLRDLAAQPGAGLAALDAALRRAAVTDLVTGEPVTARHAFADFVMANALNSFVGDGRYVYRSVEFGEGQAPAILLIRDNLDVNIPDASVNQFGTRYVLLTASAAADVLIGINGRPATPRLPMPVETTGRFYWSGTALNATASMTRAFDLSGVSAAALTFDIWHTLADSWNYVYLQVSTDDGATWQNLTTASSQTANPYGVAYGPGYTGISNPEGPRPFPYLGVGLDTNGITITEIMPDGPIASTTIQPGDTIAGFDGQPWRGTPNLIGWLATHEVGDTVSLYIQRGSAFFDVEVTLAAHPTRVFLPTPIWVPQEADLTPFSGQKILLRFLYIGLPGRDNAGFAVDNIALPALGFTDDAESGIPGWTLDGWQQTANETRQRFLAQMAILDPEQGTVRVNSLIGPTDSATGGQWRAGLPANGFILLTISGLNDDTDQPAAFGLTISRADAEATPEATGEN